MKYSHRVFLIVLLVAAAFTLSPVAALKVEGAKIMLDVTPGTTYLFPMAVSIKPDDAASNYTIDILGFGQALDGGRYEGLSPDMDTLPYSATSFLSLPSPTVQLQPGERKEFNATIRVPGNVGAGGRYAVILIHPAAAGTGQSSVATAVLVPVMLTIEGTNLTETGEITGVAVGEVIAGKPIIVSTTLKNTGNHHYYGAINQLTVKDSSGREAGSTKTDPFVRAVIPGQSVRFDTSLTAGLPAGTYTVVSRMTLEDGTLLDEESATLTVKDEYIPPFEAATLNVFYDRETVLRTPGGEIVITFPAGAVLSDAQVTVSPYREALPEPPSGSEAGTTAISVDGLTGILAKPATIVVKYNPADLQAAGGDASTLSLARWDRADVKWILLPTTVDAAAMTLTAATDRFGVMAVMGHGEQETAEGGGFLPGPHPAVLFGALAICAVFYLKRRK
jgi:hypothetical protein